VKQNLNNWSGGLAAAAIAGITAFFAEDTDFLDPMMRTQLATEMKKKINFSLQ
jgi:hypothetical protein